MVGGVSNPDLLNTRFSDFGQNCIYEIRCSYNNVSLIIGIELSPLVTLYYQYSDFLLKLYIYLFFVVLVHGAFECVVIWVYDDFAFCLN